MVKKQALISDVTGSGVDVWFEAVTITHSIKRTIIDYYSRIAYSSFLHYDAAGLIRVNVTGVVNEDVLNSRNKLLYLTNLKTNLLLCDFSTGLAYYGTISQLKTKTLTMGQLLVELEFYTAGNIGSVYEAENQTIYGGSIFTDPTLYSNDKAVRFTSNGHYVVTDDYTQNNYKYPLGEYKIIARAKCTHVASLDFKIYVVNRTDSTYPTNVGYSTVVGMNYYNSDLFELDALDEGDVLGTVIGKTTASTNTIYFDFFAIVGTEFA